MDYTEESFEKDGINLVRLPKYAKIWNFRMFLDNMHMSRTLFMSVLRILWAHSWSMLYENHVYFIFYIITLWNVKMLETILSDCLKQLKPICVWFGMSLEKIFKEIGIFSHFESRLCMRLMKVPNQDWSEFHLEKIWSWWQEMTIVSKIIFVDINSQ